MLPHPRTGELFPSPVPPGTGWPGEPADADTPVARTAAQVRARAGRCTELADLDAQVSMCRGCRRLVTWREEVATRAVAVRKAYAVEPYWGRPVTGFGADRPRIWILGLAPAAHGANRTGRVFTGDRSGDFLFASLHRVGLASSGESIDAADGLTLNDIRVVSAVRCAPPGNAPTPVERDTCEPWLAAEWRLTGRDVRVVVALGGFAWKAALDLVGAGRPYPKFGHGALAELPDGRQLLGCYHPSQQNTFTGRLTPAMLDDVFSTAKGIATREKELD
ncbi:uracil-DNA glycosylase [Mycobacterium sp. CBMA293]|uniref:uracil-DNA glycosylase n=1 Tax=unclassified Mycolicibacterium TaxID=2636767 RepID=UPI0013278520|nr:MULTISPECIES: uracil-DNA glycosylase [unclassified Mycolicibacterium]MUL46004.1 uracil-DNA glycosylase [Mycolicibacterium sp. CBMA 360]MUL95108.1 uracil-DNA glycosylase [Mycolicibacterium sp. CBMA 230]MUM33492.1 uracil-DNA glycosylase [Mycolicibacterium sp. CBMA 361]MUL60676.1 uracil-DNA glycosylase [Mycolicibacterium sp. CBMA 335]MUL72491.1 uracil-DNA glycosylase [Mycolicibacterium sp. CBMA 311]